MPRVVAKFEVVPRVIPGTPYVTPRTAVGIPPSDVDPRVVGGGTLYVEETPYDHTTTYFGAYSYGWMRVLTHGSIIIREFDSSLELP